VLDMMPPAEQMAAAMARLGGRRGDARRSSHSEWAADPSLPMETG
jgi:hypothetical protein